MAVQLLGIDHCAHAVQRYRAAGVTGAAAAGDDGEAQLNTGAHQRRDFSLAVRAQHHKRIFDSPVRRVGDVGDAGQAVELDVVAAGEPGQLLENFGAQLAGVFELFREALDGGARRRQHFADLVVALAALLHLGQPVAHRVHQGRQPLWVVQQIVDQIGIAVHHPDIAQDLEQHAGGAAGLAFGAQLLQQFPHRRAQQADENLAVGIRGVVVRDLPHTGLGGGGHCPCSCHYWKNVHQCSPIVALRKTRIH